MEFEEALKAELSTISELNNQVFPLNATEGTKAPYIVYVSSEGIQERTLDGYVRSREVDCEIHILHDKYFSLKDLTRQVISIIDSFQQRFIGGSTDVYVQASTYQKVNEMYLPDLLQYLCVLELTVRL